MTRSISGAPFGHVEGRAEDALAAFEVLRWVTRARGRRSGARSASRSSVVGSPGQLRRGHERAVVWRGVPAAIDRNTFTWASPDGSTVEAEYLVGGYGNGAYLFDVPGRLKTKLAEQPVRLAQQIDANIARDPVDVGAERGPAIEAPRPEVVEEPDPDLLPEVIPVPAQGGEVLPED